MQTIFVYRGENWKKPPFPCFMKTTPFLLAYPRFVTISLESTILLIKTSKEKIGDYCTSQNFTNYSKRSKISWQNEKKDKKK